MSSFHPIDLIKTYYPPRTEGYRALLIHSAHVAAKAVAVANSLIAQQQKVDSVFVREAALLHDIGILHTHAPEIGCHGTLPYICHGVEGRKMLEKHGLKKHALVCERHIGVGLTVDDIHQQQLPLPLREMTPQSLEEEIIAYADLFFSKNPQRMLQEKSVEKVRRQLEKYGAEKVDIFDRWHDRFGA